MSQINNGGTGVDFRKGVAADIGAGIVLSPMPRAIRFDAAGDATLVSPNGNTITITVVAGEWFTSYVKTIETWSPGGDELTLVF